MVNQSQNALQELQQLCMVSTSKLIQSKWEVGSVQHGNTMVSFPWYNKMSLQTFLTVWIFQNKFSKISMAVLCKQSTYSKSKINLLVGTVLVKFNYSRLSKRYHLQITDNSPAADNLRKFCKFQIIYSPALLCTPKYWYTYLDSKGWGKTPIIRQSTSHSTNLPLPSPLIHSYFWYIKHRVHNLSYSDAAH